MDAAFRDGPIRYRGAMEWIGAERKYGDSSHSTSLRAGCYAQNDGATIGDLIRGSLGKV